MNKKILSILTVLLAAASALVSCTEKADTEPVNLPEELYLFGQGCEFSVTPRAMREVEPGRWVVYSRFNKGLLVRILYDTDTTHFVYRGRVPSDDIYRLEYNANIRKASWVRIDGVSLEPASGSAVSGPVQAQYVSDGRWKVKGLVVRDPAFRYRYAVETNKPDELSVWCSPCDNVGSAPSALDDDYLRVRDLGDEACSVLYIKDTRACWMFPQSALPASADIDIDMNGPAPGQSIAFGPLPAHKGPAVIFMGDSITWQWTREGVAHPSSIALFEARNWLNKGISGNTTTQMVTRFRADVIAQDPSCVVILGGTNDISNSPESAILGRLRTMAEMAVEAGIPVVMCSVTPCNNINWSPDFRPEERIIRLNGMIHAYAASMGFPYADYYSVLVDDAKGLKVEYQAKDHTDPVHPNGDGYLQMEAVIIPILDNLLNNN